MEKQLVGLKEMDFKSSKYTNGSNFKESIARALNYRSSIKARFQRKWQDSTTRDKQALQGNGMFMH